MPATFPRKLLLRAYCVLRWPTLVLTVILTLPWLFFNDDRLGRFIESQANPGLRGRLEFRGIHWRPRAYLDFLLGQPTPAHAAEFCVRDPGGKLVMRVVDAEVEYSLRDLLRLDFVMGRVHARYAEAHIEEILDSHTGKKAANIELAFAGKRPKGGPGPLVRIGNAIIDRLDLDLHFTGWGVELRQGTAVGPFSLDGRAGGKSKLRFDINVSGRRGSLLIGDEIRLPLEDAHLTHFGTTDAHPLDLMVAGLRARIAGTEATLRGGIRNLHWHPPGQVPAVDVIITAENAGGLLSTIVGPSLGGETAAARFTIRGPISDPRFEGTASGVVLDLPRLRVSELSGHLWQEHGILGTDDAVGRLQGGRLRASARLDLHPTALTYRATAEIADGDLAPLLPGSTARRWFGGRVSGRATLAGSFRDPSRVQIRELDARLARHAAAAATRLPRVLRARGSLLWAGGRLDTRGLVVEGDGARLSLRGSLAPGRRQLALAAALEGSGLSGWWARLRLPQLVTALGVNAELRGRLALPTVSGRFRLAGLGIGAWRMPQLGGELAFADGRLELRRLEGAPFRGQLLGEATLDLFRGSLARLRPAPSLRLSLRGSELDLASLPLAGLGGRASLRLELAGPLSRLTGTADLSVDGLLLAGDRYGQASGRLSLSAAGLELEYLRLRRARGGELSAEGLLEPGGSLRAILVARDLPIAAIPGVVSLPFEVGGAITGRLELSGDTSHPAIAGRLELSAARLRQIQLGNGRLELAPGGDAIEVSGEFFRRFRLDGYLFLKPRIGLALTITFDQLAVEELLPELAEHTDLKLRTSGTIRLTLDAARGLTFADARLSRLHATLGGDDVGATRKPLRLEAVDEVHAVYDGQRVRLLRPLRLHGEGADFLLEGQVGQSGGSDLHVKGEVRLELFELLTRQLFERLSGRAIADLHLRGDLRRPRLGGYLAVSEAEAWPRGLDQPVKLRGRLDFGGDHLRLGDFAVELAGATLTSSGRLGLRDLRPTDVQLALSGNLSAHFLELIFRGLVTEAQGQIGVQLKVEGPLGDPQVEGNVEPRQVQLSVRGLGRDITVERGTISFSNYLLRLRGVQALIEDGQLTFDGAIRLDQWKLADIDLRAQGVSLPSRSLGVYEVEANTDLRLSGDDRALSLSGKVDLVDSRYVQKFSIVQDAVFKPKVAETPRPPFWKGHRLLEEMALDLHVRTAGPLWVKNDYADLSLLGSLDLGGTLSEPSFDGIIRAEEGRFRIPFLRGEYTLRSGTVYFDREKEMPEESPEIQLESEGVYEDRNEMEHLIRLTLKGTLAHLEFDLSTNTGLSRQEVLTLLTTGRTTDQLRAALRGEGAGSGQTAAAATDQAARELTGSIFNELVEQPLKAATQLDLVRFEVGSETLQLRLGKRIGRRIRLGGEYQLGLLGGARQQGNAELRLLDDLSLVGEAERLVRGQDTDQENLLRGKLQIKYRWRLR